MKRALFFVFAFSFLYTTALFPQEEDTVRVYPAWAILNAAFVGDADFLRDILETNPDIDIRDSMGATALHIAIFQENLEILQLLLEYGFDINAQVPSNGYTPLHYCVRMNNLNAARFLLAHNADRTIRDSDGYTPMERATKEAKRDMIILFMRY